MGWNHWSELSPFDLTSTAGDRDEAWSALADACRFLEDVVAAGGTVAFTGAGSRATARRTRAPFLGRSLATDLQAAPASADRILRLALLTEQWNVGDLLDLARDSASWMPEGRSLVLGEQPDVIVALGEAPDLAPAHDFGIPVVATAPRRGRAAVSFELLGDAEDTRLLRLYAAAVESAVTSARRQFYEQLEGLVGSSYWAQIGVRRQDGNDVRLNRRLASLETVDAEKVLAEWDDGSDVTLDLA